MNLTFLSSIIFLIFSCANNKHFVPNRVITQDVSKHAEQVKTDKKTKRQLANENLAMSTIEYLVSVFHLNVLRNREFSGKSREGSSCTLVVQKTFNNSSLQVVIFEVDRKVEFFIDQRRSAPEVKDELRKEGTYSLIYSQEPGPPNRGFDLGRTLTLNQFDNSIEIEGFFSGKYSCQINKSDLHLFAN